MMSGKAKGAGTMGTVDDTDTVECPSAEDAVSLFSFSFILNRTPRPMSSTSSTLPNFKIINKVYYLLFSLFKFLSFL